MLRDGLHVFYAEVSDNKWKKKPVVEVDKTISTENFRLLSRRIKINCYQNWFERKNLLHDFSWLDLKEKRETISFCSFQCCYCLIKIFIKVYITSLMSPSESFRLAMSFLIWNTTSELQHIDAINILNFHLKICKRWIAAKHKLCYFPIIVDVAYTNKVLCV